MSVDKISITAMGTDLRKCLVFNYFEKGAHRAPEFYDLIVKILRFQTTRHVVLIKPCFRWIRKYVMQN